MRVRIAAPATIAPLAPPANPNPRRGPLIRHGLHMVHKTSQKLQTNSTMRQHEVTAVNVWETSLPSQVVNKANQLNLNKNIYALFANRRSYYVQHEDGAGHRYLSVRLVDELRQGPFFEFLGLLLVDNKNEDVEDFLTIEDLLSIEGPEYLKQLEKIRFRNALLQVVPQTSGKFVLELAEYNLSSVCSIGVNDGEGLVNVVPINASLPGIQHAMDIVVRPFVNEEDAGKFKIKVSEPVEPNPLGEIPKPVVIKNVETAAILYESVIYESSYTLVDIKAIPHLKRAGLRGYFPEFLNFINRFLDEYKPSSLESSSICYVQADPKIYQENEVPEDPDANLTDDGPWSSPYVEDILADEPVYFRDGIRVTIVE